jgi:hypothetical protein
MLVRRTLLGSLVLAVACSAASADRTIAAPSPDRIALGGAPIELRAPYDVQIVRDDGELLPTYGHAGRFYVQGDADDRYIIRIVNPTARRVEAVVTVDGLDVIDGENGDLRKRGYVVPAYGETQIEGFRTSQSDVATFRFSSVGDSYAGQSGRPRNVGVIAVALFEEQPRPEPPIMVGERPPYRPQPRPYHGDDSASADRPAAGSPANKAAGDDGRASAAPAAASQVAPEGRVSPGAAAPRERPGLGTEFGEQRMSAASFTRFVRAPGRPVAIAELRYNDAAGLIALGIPVQRLPDAGEIYTRETADPFPGDHFARAPQR